MPSALQPRPETITLEQYKAPNGIAATLFQNETALFQNGTIICFEKQTVTRHTERRWEPSATYFWTNIHYR